MIAPHTALRACLIGIVALQTLLLPAGHCCCAAHRIIDVLTGGNTPPACCRLAQPRGDREANPAGRLEADETPRRKCHCAAGAVAAQKSAPSDAELEACLKWVDVWVFEATPVEVERFRDVGLSSRRPPTLSPSGLQFRIALHSWLC